MAVCGLRTLLLIVCIIELIITTQRQVFDFLGFMWLPIIANFVNILLIIFGSFGAVLYITKYLIATEHTVFLALLYMLPAMCIMQAFYTIPRHSIESLVNQYAIWSLMWLTWNVFLICYYLNLGSLNRESGLLSLGTGSVSWWESNGWGCQPVWGEVDGPGSWRPVRVDGCFLQWQHVELAQSAVAALITATALPLAVMLAYRSFKKIKPATSDKGTLPRRPVYTIELSPAETNISETSLKPMTPRRVKRRSGSRGNNGSVRRSRRSYRNAGYLASTASLPRESSRPSRPTSAHSSYSNFHAARPKSYHAPERDTLSRETLSRSQDVYEPPPPTESVPILTNRYDTVRRPPKPSGYDVAGPYNEPRGYEPPPPRHYENTVQHYDDGRSHGYEYEGAMGNYDGRYDRGTPCESPAYGGSYGGGGEGAWEAPPPPAPPYSARATPQAPGPPAYQQANDPY